MSAPLDATSAQERVLGWQTKLHRWAEQDEHKRFGDVFNLLCDPATLLVAWERVKRNRGSKTAGVDGQTRWHVEQRGVETILGELRQSLRDGSYTPLPVREHEIPKRGSGKVRRLGLPALRDRIVQMATTLVLEPIWEAEFQPSPAGRPISWGSTNSRKRTITVVAIAEPATDRWMPSPSRMRTLRPP